MTTRCRTTDIYCGYPFQKISKLGLKIREKTRGLNKSRKKWSWRFNVFNSQVQLFFKNSSPGLFKSVTNPKSSGLTKKELKKQCYHDKDSKHHRTPISFLKGKINYRLISISIYLFTLQRKSTWCMIWISDLLNIDQSRESPPDSHKIIGLPCCHFTEII